VEDIGDRMSVFLIKKAPYSVVFSGQNEIRIEAITDVEVAFAKAPGRAF